MLIKSFTIQANSGLLREIRSECTVYEAFDPKGLSDAHIAAKKSVKCMALWDTGASNTVITPKLAKALNLPVTGMVNVNHAGGTSLVPKHIVNIMLPNDVGIPFTEVTEGNLTGIDMLIGMDIISRGDFSITNVGGKTTFSFRIPSVETIDYCQNSGHVPPVKPIVKASKVGRNDPCPCGSGKKFKHCCGR